MRGQIGQIICTERRGPDALTPKKTGKSGPTMNAQIHDGRRFGLRMKGDEMVTEHSEWSGQGQDGQKGYRRNTVAVLNMF